MREIRRALAPVKRRIRAQRVLCWGAYGALAAAGCAVVMRAVSFACAFERLWVCVSCMAAGMTCAAVLAAAVWPVSDWAAAKRADAHGLRERAQTAVSLDGDESPMAWMQREDALACLRAFEPRRAMKLKIPRRAWLGVLLCAAALGLSLLIPNPQDALILQRETFRADMNTQAEKVEQGADALSDDDPQTQPTRKLLAELAQALRRAENKREALEAIDDAERTLLQMQQKTADETLNALRGSGLEAVAQALQSEQTFKAQEALEALDAQSALETLSEAALSAGDEAAAQALTEAANAMQAGDAAQAAQLLQDASATTATGAIAQAMALAAMARNAAAKSGAAGTSGQSGQGGDGQDAGGTSQQSHGAGNGAGVGTSDKDGGTGANAAASGAQGDADPQKKTGTYETIYDPTRLGGAGETVNETGETGTGEVTEIQLGTGEGVLAGEIPYEQALPEYREQAVEAVQNGNLPDYAQKWVQEYFAGLE